MKNTLLLLIIIFTSVAYSQQLPEKPIHIPFTQTAGGHIIITATINGINGNFIFDTGAGMNLLTKKFADKITDLKKNSTLPYWSSCNRRRNSF
ncbi:aspartyl protease family protein [uncultured Dokdonia sp.]|uniref:aspartyl protease family protein n=1 Tax=Dokdonia sp. R78006 TaxID=3093866 RepID=UPI0026388010|nr:aspartyl protease family protein [uncultured Dokdonia sp.]